MRWAKSTAASGSLHVDHQHGELVAAQAGHGVARSDDRGQQPAGPHQDAVADVVAQGVVDRLEPVEVAEAQGHRLDPIAGDAARACSTRSCSRARLASPVSSSWKAR